MTHAALPKTIGERIVWARKRKGISQEGLAVMVGTSRRHMIRLEKNHHAPGPELRKQLSAVLDENPEFFTEKDDDEDDSELSLDVFLARYIQSAVRKAMEVTT